MENNDQILNENKEVNTTSFEYTDPFKEKEQSNKSPVLPAGGYKDMEKLIKGLERFKENNEKDGDKSISDEDVNLISTTIDLLKCTLTNELGDKFKQNNNSLFNTLKYDNKDLGIEYLNYTNNINRNNQAAVLARFKAMLGIGRPINITLYHSGFSIKLKPATVAQLTALESALYSDSLEIGKNTLGLLINYDRAITIETFVDLFKDLIIESSLKVEKEDIFKYINILDFDTILLGVLHSTNINKIAIRRTCRNIFNITEDGTLACNHTVSAEVDPSKLLFVNKELLTEDMLKQLSYKTANVITLEEYNSYQESLKAILLKKELIKTEYYVNDDFVLELKMPTITEYIEKSKTIISKFTDLIDKITKSNSNITSEAIKETIHTVFGLVDFLPVINSLSIPSAGLTLDKTSSILDILEESRRNKDLTSKITDLVNEFYNNSLVSLVALPNYTCPECHKDQTTNNNYNGFSKEFIPLNVLSFFVYLDITLGQY